MKIQVEVISQELVKPLSPTPHHLRHLDFSFIDQMTPQISRSLVHFFSNESTISNLQKCNLLKKSLSQVLNIFYPLAGRVRNDTYIDCNDEGFLFVEARASCELTNVLQERDPINNTYFTPFRPEKAGDLAGFSQITLFKCGGIAISFGMCHKLGDASSMFTFLKSWAAMARGDTKSFTTPSFGHAATFPPINMPKFDQGLIFSNEKLITKIFEFDRSSIEAIIAKHTTAKGNGRRLSRVEALSGFIIGRYIVTTQTQNAINRQCWVDHMVDLRQRMEPPMPKRSFGNFSSRATVETQIDGKDEYCYGISEKIRNSVTNLAEYFKKHLDKPDEMRNFIMRKMEAYGRKEVVSFAFSSVNKLSAYETDFGWGKPLWVGTTPLLGKNLAMFFETKDGEGIEAWISLNEEEMAKFEADNKLLPHGRLLNAYSRL